VIVVPSLKRTALLVAASLLAIAVLLVMPLLLGQLHRDCCPLVACARVRVR